LEPAKEIIMTDREQTQDPTADLSDDKEFGDDHPLSSPSELAGTAFDSINAELAAHEVETQSDAAGAAVGAELESDDIEELGADDPGRRDSLPLSGQ
jgi:hypothetical protein